MKTEADDTPLEPSTGKEIYNPSTRAKHMDDMTEEVERFEAVWGHSPRANSGSPPCCPTVAPRTISEHEMDRRRAMLEAKFELTRVMGEVKTEMTAIEWVNVLNEIAARMISHGLRNEWDEDG